MATIAPRMWCGPWATTRCTQEGSQPGGAAVTAAGCELEAAGRMLHSTPAYSSKQAGGRKSPAATPLWGHLAASLPPAHLDRRLGFKGDKAKAAVLPLVVLVCRAQGAGAREGEMMAGRLMPGRHARGMHADRCMPAGRQQSRVDSRTGKRCQNTQTVSHHPSPHHAAGTRPARSQSA